MSDKILEKAVQHWHGTCFDVLFTRSKEYIAKIAHWASHLVFKASAKSELEVKELEAKLYKVKVQLSKEICLHAIDKHSLDAAQRELAEWREKSERWEGVASDRARGEHEQKSRVDALVVELAESKGHVSKLNDKVRMFQKDYAEASEARQDLMVIVDKLTAKLAATVEREKAYKKFKDAVCGASCDSRSGLYCDDDSCANKVIPRALDVLDSELKDPSTRSIHEAKEQVLGIDPACVGSDPEEKNRDWLEDYGHENGSYINLCVNCGRKFVGHKRRFVCKKCAAPPSTGSQVRANAEKDPNYAPYCLRCPGNVRMVKVEPFYWRCACGAEHDERRGATSKSSETA